MAVNELETDDIIQSLILLDKQPGWEFAIDIEGAPDELGTLAKDLEYEPITINVEEMNYGAQQFTMPVNQERVTINVTLRDTKDKKLYKWCKEIAAKVVHSDGTFGIPAEYVRRVTIFSLTNKEEDKSPDEYYMIFTNVGSLNRDRASKDFFEFPITITQFKTSGLGQSKYTQSIITAAETL